MTISKFQNKNYLTTSVIVVALIAFITALVKFTDSFDSLVERSKSIRAIREKEIEQDMKIDSLAYKLDEIKTDTKTILKELRRQ